MEMNQGTLFQAKRQPRHSHKKTLNTKVKVKAKAEVSVIKTIVEPLEL